MVNYRLTKKGKVVVVLLCSFMLLSVTLGVSLFKEKPANNAYSDADMVQTKPANVVVPPQTPVSTEVQQGQADTTKDQLDKLKLSVFFEPNTSSLSIKYDKDLDNFVEAAKKHEALKIQVEGNCATLYDNNKNEGRKSVNFYLSLKRAQSIADYLRDKGIPPERLVVVANGSDKPLKDNDTLAGREYNRRVDVFFLSK